MPGLVRPECKMVVLILNGLAPMSGVAAVRMPLSPVLWSVCPTMPYVYENKSTKVVELVLTRGRVGGRLAKVTVIEEPWELSCLSEVLGGL